MRANWAFSYKVGNFIFWLSSAGRLTRTRLGCLGQHQREPGRARFGHAAVVEADCCNLIMKVSMPRLLLFERQELARATLAHSGVWMTCSNLLEFAGGLILGKIPRPNWK